MKQFEFCHELHEFSRIFFKKFVKIRVIRGKGFILYNV
jgi:hypothetical protein